MHLRQFIRVCERQGGYLQACRHTAKIYDAEFHTLMGWIMMHYLLGLL